jgi:hypothetical protein
VIAAGALEEIMAADWLYLALPDAPAPGPAFLGAERAALESERIATLVPRFAE